MEDSSFVAVTLMWSSLCFVRNLLNGQNDPDSDGDDEDEFAPSKKELQSSSEEEEEDVEGVDELDSDEEVLKKKKRRPSTAPQTPRSRQKPRPSTRTPRKTPSRKVSMDSGSLQGPLEGSLHLHRFCLLSLLRARRGLHATPRPASPAGYCQPDSPPTCWKRPESGQQSSRSPFFHSVFMLLVWRKCLFKLRIFLI